MTYDCIIVGAGLSGLTCGIKLASEGVRTVIFSSGRNALHFSSGSIDLLGYDKNNSPVREPLDYLPEFLKENPGHPYGKMTEAKIIESLDFFKEQTGKEGVPLEGMHPRNHFHVSGLGTVKPTYLSQPTVFNERIMDLFRKKCKIAVINFKGYRDYYAAMTVSILKKSPLFADKEITVGNIQLPHYTKTEKNLHEFRSIDLARVFDSERFLPRIASEIKEAAGDADIVSLPAFLGIDNYMDVHEKLEKLTGKVIYEIPSLPPSILGMRIDNALRTVFAALGGELSTGDSVIGGEIQDDSVNHVHTEHHGDTQHRASFYVMSSGSFFSGGLSSGFNSLSEPVFGLKINGSTSRNDWYSKEFFSKTGHPFLEYGVETDGSFCALSDEGNVIKNLFCTGAILSGYNPVREASGGGVAIATGYTVAEKIISELRTG